MNEQEKLRDFCAIKVMGFTRGTRSQLSASEGRTFYHDGFTYKWLDDYGAFTAEFDPAERPQDALLVLEKCHSRTVFPILTGVKSDGHYCCECIPGDGGEAFAVPMIAAIKGHSTLRLAICLFAKKLFSK